MKQFIKMTLALTASGMLLGGCATTEAVKRAQATADEALALAQRGNTAAQQAQATADGAVAAAARAQTTANGAQAAAEAADNRAQAAGAEAAKAQRTFWQHHDRHHPHKVRKD